MESVFNIFLVLHIAGGTVGLITGAINLLRVKGDRFHKFVGKCFLFGMISAGFSALVLSLIHPNYFLFIVGVFTLYLAGTGSRYIHLKMLGKTQGPAKMDWVITASMILAAALFAGFGIKTLVSGNTFGIVLLVFGFLGINFVRRDLKNYKGENLKKNFWLVAHLQRMTGAYIAALTAFLVVNSNYLPEFIPGAVYWLLPTILLVPFIVRWSRKYEPKRQVSGIR